MRAPQQEAVYSNEGHFWVEVLHEGRWEDVSFLRGAPTIIQSFSFTDPFGPSTAEIEFPSVTTFDTPGHGDIAWMKDMTQINIRWSADDDWVWEGNIVSLEGDTSLRVQCKGALYVLDNDLAKPTYPTNPVPYEILIKSYCDQYPDLGSFDMRFPDKWNVIYRGVNSPSYLWMLPPTGIANGEPWTGLATRSTGSWDKRLTGFVQGLLSSMYTPEGDQWTLDLEQNRRPVMKVREKIYSANDDTYQITNGSQGVQIRLSKDWSQSANVVYGSGSDLYGLKFTNMEVVGEATRYTPFAHHPLAYPHAQLPRREVYLDFAPGVDKIAASGIAHNHYQTNADPGWVGSVTLQVDPMTKNGPRSRWTIRAGDTICIRGWMGASVLLHVTQMQANPEDGTVSLNVDSRYRDVLTASEVYARTRDALNPLHSIKIGRSSITINDLVKPWSYVDGSGMIPYEARGFFQQFRDLDAGAFPWENATRRFPPATFGSYYVKLDRTRDLTRRGKFWSAPFRILLSQEGTIRLTQFAAYDINGNVVPCNFHFSIWDRHVQYTAMPQYPDDGTPTRLPVEEGDYYPFFADAFLEVSRTGEMKSEGMSLMPKDATNLSGWGTYEEPAGYTPGLASQGNPATGMLVDETLWTFNTTSWAGAFDPTSKANTAKNPDAGIVYGIVYADTEETDLDNLFFLGRLWNVPAGNG